MSRRAGHRFFPSGGSASPLESSQAPSVHAVRSSDLSWLEKLVSAGAFCFPNLIHSCNGSGRPEFPAAHKPPGALLTPRRRPKPRRSAEPRPAGSAHPSPPTHSRGSGSPLHPRTSYPTSGGKQVLPQDSLFPDLQQPGQKPRSLSTPPRGLRRDVHNVPGTPRSHTEQADVNVPPLSSFFHQPFPSRCSVYTRLETVLSLGALEIRWQSGAIQIFNYSYLVPE